MRKRTSAEDIRQKLAQRIVAGELQPGTSLDETLLAGEYDVSRTPVREALRLLAASGLVDQRAHAKAIVAKPDEVDLRGMFDVMAELEALCAGRAALAMDARERDALDALHARMAGIVREGNARAYAEANDVFHSAIYEGAHNAYLCEITHSTRTRLHPFRRAQFNAMGRLGKSHTEHGLIVDAILQGDRAAAEAAMRSHISIVETAYQHLSAN